MPNTSNYNFDAPGEMERWKDLTAERNAPMAGAGLRPEEFRALQSNLGSGLQAPLMAVNPKTGQMERVYVQNGLDENGTGVDKAYFESDPNKPHDAMAGLAGGYSPTTAPVDSRACSLRVYRGLAWRPQVHMAQALSVLELWRC
jgi:hypothetical protein